MPDEKKTADIGELVKRLGALRNLVLPADPTPLDEAIRALTALEARCAELEDELTETSQHWPDWAKQIYKFMRGLGYYEGSVDEVHLPDDLEEWFEEAVSSEVSRRDRIEREPVVKALEWRKKRKGSGTIYHADGCDYAIVDNHGLGFNPGIRWNGQTFHSLDAAKAAAQADYERRILSALATSERVEAEPWSLLSALVAQFDHAGCTCTFPAKDCCAFAEAEAALASNK